MITLLMRFILQNAVIELEHSQFFIAFNDPPKKAVPMLLVFIEGLLIFTLTHRMFCKNKKNLENFFGKQTLKDFVVYSSYISINSHIPRIAVHVLSEVKKIPNSTFQYFSKFKESCPVSVLCHYGQR